MLTKKDRKIRNQEAMIENRNVLIADMERQANTLYEENKDLKCGSQELRLLLHHIIKELYSNIKTDEQKIRKLKELVDDYQSTN